VPENVTAGPFAPVVVDPHRRRPHNRSGNRTVATRSAAKSNALSQSSKRPAVCAARPTNPNVDGPPRSGCRSWLARRERSRAVATKARPGSVRLTSSGCALRSVDGMDRGVLGTPQSGPEKAQSTDGRGLAGSAGHGSETDGSLSRRSCAGAAWRREAAG
jgi:hypothetical protein